VTGCTKTWSPFPTLCKGNGVRDNIKSKANGDGDSAACRMWYFEARGETDIRTEEELAGPSARGTIRKSSQTVSVVPISRMT
jgi:hypothetical protein